MRFPVFTLALLLACPALPALAQVAPQAPAAEKEENPLVLARVKDSVDGFALSPDGKSVLVWGVDWGDPNQANPKRRGKVQVWDVATHTLLANMAGHSDAVQSALWSRDGKQIVSQSQDGMVALWDVASGELKSTLVPSRGKADLNAAAPEERQRALSSIVERARPLGFSPDGSQLLAMGAKFELPKVAPKDKDGKPVPLQLFDYVQPFLVSWDTASGRLVRSVPFGSKGAQGVASALLPDGQSILTVINARLGPEVSEAKVEVRDVQSGAVRSSWTLPKPFTYVAKVSEDGSRVLGVVRDSQKFDLTRAQVFEAATGKPLQLLQTAEAGTNLMSGRFSRDNQKLLAEVRGGALAFFDIASGQRERLLSTDFSNGVSQAQITPDGKYLLAAQEAGRDLLRFDLSTPLSNPVASRPLSEASNVRAIRFAPDGSLWVGWGEQNWNDNQMNTGKALQLRHVTSAGQVLDSIEVPDARLIDQVTFSADFSLAAASLGTQPQPGYIQGAGVGVWDVAGKKLLWHLPGPRSMIDKLAFAPDNRTLLANSNEGAVQEWDMATGKVLRTLFKSEKSVESLRFSPDGKQVAVGTEDGVVTVLAMPTGEELTSFGNDPSLGEIAWSADSKYLATGTTLEVGGERIGVSVSVWEVATEKIVAEFSVPARIFWGLAFSPGGQRLVAAHLQSYERSDDGQVSVWDIPTKRLLATLRDQSGAQHPTFSPNGQTLVTTNGQWLKAWDLPADWGGVPVKP